MKVETEHGLWFVIDTLEYVLELSLLQFLNNKITESL